MKSGGALLSSSLPSMVVMGMAMLAVAARASGGKRVLLFPWPLNSHAYQHVELAHALKDRGHEPWLVMPEGLMKKGFLNTAGLGVITYSPSMDMDDDYCVELFFKPFLAQTEIDEHKVVEIGQQFSEEVFRNDTLFQEMKKVKADLFVFDDTIAITAMLAVFPYRLGIPFVCLDFTFRPFMRRIPFSPATIPTFMTDMGVGEVMTFRQRLLNTWAWVMDYVNTPGHELYEDAVRRYAPEMPYLSLDQLLNRAEVWLVQLDHVFFYPYPTVPNVKLIGALAAGPAKPLPAQYQQFMDGANEGAVVVSFGSLVVELPQPLIDKLMQAFLQLAPLKVVFRMNATSPDPARIMTSSWIPQNGLLAHPNCRVYVTHCGQSSQYQGMYHGVPMLGMPMAFDQWYNADILQRKGFGTYLDIRKASVQDIVTAVRHVAEDTRYKHNLLRASRLFREQYGVPLNTALYWLDHVMQFGGGHMRSAGQLMPMYQFLLLDVAACVMAVVVTAVILVTCCCACWCQRLWSGKTSTAGKNKRD